MLASSFHCTDRRSTVGTIVTIRPPCDNGSGVQLHPDIDDQIA
jgi:hypothetical protein